MISHTPHRRMKTRRYPRGSSSPGVGVRASPTAAYGRSCHKEPVDDHDADEEEDAAHHGMGDEDPLGAERRDHADDDEDACDVDGVRCCNADRDRRAPSVPAAEGRVERHEAGERRHLEQRRALDSDVEHAPARCDCGSPSPTAEHRGASARHDATSKRPVRASIASSAVSKPSACATNSTNITKPNAPDQVHPQPPAGAEQVGRQSEPPRADNQDDRQRLGPGVRDLVHPLTQSRHRVELGGLDVETPRRSMPSRSR